MKLLSQDTGNTGHAGYQQQVKEGNIKRIFDLIRGGKCKSRAELVRVMNLSATSVSVLVEELASRHLIEEVGPTQTTLPGRRPISLRLNSNAYQIPVFTLQRDGVRYMLLNLECQIQEQLFCPLDAGRLNAENGSERYAALIEDILLRQSRLYDPLKTLVVGVCVPGSYVKSLEQFFTQSALGFCLSEQSMEALQKRLHLPIYLLNRNKSLAYAEKKYLDAANPDNPETQDLLYVEVKDRISCTPISNGDIYIGPFNISGEIGHMTIDYRGRPCPCGSYGCLERYANQNAILEDAVKACEAVGIDPPKSFEELAARYPDEPALLESVKRSAELLAIGLYSVLCDSGMRHIVLGGGIEALGAPFLEELRSVILKRPQLVRHLDLYYAQAGRDAESTGIVHHFLDKVYTITA